MELGRRTRRWLTATGILALMAVAFLGSRAVQSSGPQSDAALAVAGRSAATGPAPLSDEELQRAADELLGGVNPARPENGHFTEFAKDKLRWLNGEHAAGRLTVAFFIDTETIGLPSSVMMAATQLDRQPTIVIAKPRFATWHVGIPWMAYNQRRVSSAGKRAVN